MSNRIDGIVQQLIDCELANESEIRGCSEPEIASLENDLNIKFPQSYKDFLSCMGREAGRLFRGSDVFYSRIRELHGYAIELLEESQSQFELPEKAHVFYMHQGYVFLYFVADGKHDPAVFQFIEGDQEAKQIDDSFSEFLKRSVGEAQQMASKLQAYRDQHNL